MKNIKQQTTRNNKLVDRWSLVHLLSSAILCYFFGPVAAFVATTLWEPFEILILSPILAKYDILFGHEAVMNSLSDIVFNTIGIMAASTLIL